MDDFNTTQLCPLDGNNLDEWIELNKQWVIREKELIQVMLVNSNDKKEDPKKTPYGIFSQESTVINRYNNRLENRVNLQLKECYNLTSDNVKFNKLKKRFQNNNYPSLNLDDLDFRPLNWSSNSTSGATYSGVRGFKGGKLHKSKKSKKSKRSRKYK